MRTRIIVFIVFVASVALAALPHRPTAKIQDRMVTDGDRRFCGFYYAWRETQTGGVPAVDRLCFDLQVMMP
jgi:hypothetical protein